MIDLDPKIWKSLVVKCKLKDNGLEGALSDYAKLEDDAHDECLKTIAKVSQLANALKRAKEVAAAAQALKYLTDLVSTAEKEKSDVAKAKAAADKAQADADKLKLAAQKAQDVADAKKQAADQAEADEKKKGGDEEDDAKGGKDAKQDKGFKNLIVQMLQRVKTARPDAPFQYLVCDAKPFPCVMIAPRINASHKKLLEKTSGGSKRFLKPGTITFEDGHYCFESQKNIPGYARKVQGFLKNLTGKKYPVMFGTQKATDEDEPGADAAAGGEAAAERGAARGAGDGAGESGSGAGAGAPEAAAAAAGGRFSISGSVGKGGKNKPEDVQAVQTALNAKAKAGLTVDGKCGPATIKAIMAFQQNLGKFKPDGLIEVGRGTARALASSAPMGPPPAPPSPVAPPKLGKGTLDKAPDAWRGMHGILGKNVEELKKAVRSEYASEHPTLVKDIEQGLKKLDQILKNIGSELADRLGEANAAKAPADRKAKLLACKALVAKHITYVKSEPLIAHIDRNPFGVATNFQRIMTDHLVHVAQAIGTVA